MTKHLRFLIVLLMTLVWSVGWAQTTIWSEDWTGGKDNQTPSTFIPAIYTQSSNKNVFIYESDEYAGGKAPELMIKSNSSWTVKITDLKGCKGDVTLTLKTNKKSKLSVSVGSSAINLTAVEGQTKTFSGTFNVDELVVPFNITFKNTATGKKENLRLDDIKLIGTSVEESKTATNVSFGANTGNTFTFTEGEYTDGTFTAPTATETKGIEGTIVYSSDNESAVKVNASTGALSFPGYGEATITATFTPTDADTYAVSTDSYKVKNERGVVAGTITFDKANGAFDLLNANGYGTAKYDFVSDTNESYTFDCKGVMKTYANKGCLQIQKNTGKVASPAFPKFTNGYKVNIIYSSKKALQLSAGDANVVIGTTTSSNNTNGLGASVSISVPANVPFVITSGGSDVTYVSKIEIIPNKIDETETLTLNETAPNTIEAKTGVNVTLNRPMNVGRWNTFCVPFSIDANQVTSQFGEGTQIAEYSVSKSKDDVIDFATVQSNAIVAGKAYLVKPTKVAATEGYTFSNVNITALVPTKETVDNGAIDFRGIYNPTDITVGLPTNTFAAGIVGNVVKKAVSGSNMKGFRAFFIIPDAGAQSSYMLKIDGTATSINSINGADVVVNAPVYNLQGQRVDGNNLTPGIYVKAGKKFVVK